MIKGIKIRLIEKQDEERIALLLEKAWGSRNVVTRGKMYDAAALSGFLALESEDVWGLLTMRVDGDECEVVTLDAFVQGQGIGKALLREAFEYARGLGCRRTWLITTNDNLSAMAFYQKCGMRMVAIYPDAVTEARKLKPQIPLVADNGIPIRDEVEFETI